MDPALSRRVDNLYRPPFRFDGVSYVLDADSRVFADFRPVVYASVWRACSPTRRPVIAESPDSSAPARPLWGSREACYRESGPDPLGRCAGKGIVGASALREHPAACPKRWFSDIRVRGWGRIRYLEDPAHLQDAVFERIKSIVPAGTQPFDAVALLNASWGPGLNAPGAKCEPRCGTFAAAKVKRRAKLAARAARRAARGAKPKRSDRGEPEANRNHFKRQRESPVERP